MLGLTIDWSIIADVVTNLRGWWNMKDSLLVFADTQIKYVSKWILHLVQCLWSTITLQWNSRATRVVFFVFVFYTYFYQEWVNQTWPEFVFIPYIWKNYAWYQRFCNVKKLLFRHYQMSRNIWHWISWLIIAIRYRQCVKWYIWLICFVSRRNMFAAKILNFLHDKPWIPGGEKSILTAVIH